MTASSLNSAAALTLPVGTTPDDPAEAPLVAAAQGGCPDAFRALVGEPFRCHASHHRLHYATCLDQFRKRCGRSVEIQRRRLSVVRR